jgi:hypothetical protein
MDGQTMYPTMYGDKGWYAYTPRKYDKNARELWYLSMKAEDRARLAEDGWPAFLDGKAANYPEEALRRDLERLRQRVAAMRKDTTTPDTRLADDPLQYNPASVTSLIELALGGLPPGRNGSILHCRLRYFDPGLRRAGLSEDVAALVEKLTPDQATVTLVNTNPVEARTLIVQAGGYGEHQLAAVTVDGKKVPVDSTHFTVRLAPGAGGQLVLDMRRYANRPTLSFPWDR